jgi:hypothetical protein
MRSVWLIDAELAIAYFRHDLLQQFLMLRCARIL